MAHLLNFAVGTIAYKNLFHEIFEKILIFIITESYSEKICKIHPWEVSLICRVNQFSIRGTIRMEILFFEIVLNFYEDRNLF